MNRTVLVNGGSRGIGAAIVRLLRERCYRVYFTYHTSRKEAEKLATETGSVAVLADAASENEVKNAVKFVAEDAGNLDVLINNAAVSSFSLLTDLSTAEWEKTMAVNLTAPFLYCRSALPYMIRQKWGRIVNIVSMWGETGSSCEVHYSAAKAGLIGLTKALAKEVGPSGITVNAVSPGVIDTDMNRTLTPETMADLCDQTPLCRIGRPEEVALAAAYLVSDDASFITGEILRVNGGFLI